MTDIPVIELIAPMPGFPAFRKFALVELDDDGLLYQLRSVENPELRFLVMPPVPFFPDYAPEVGEDVVEGLAITSVEDVIVLVVVSAGDSLEASTANLLAPIIVNTVNRRACQAILDDADLPIAAPLVA